MSWESVMFSGILQPLINKILYNYTNIWNDGYHCCSSAETERGDSLVNVVFMRVRNSLNAGDLPDLMTILSLGKELADWDATPFVKSWLNCNHSLATHTRVCQKSLKTFCENQLTLWTLQYCIYISLLFAVVCSVALLPSSSSRVS